MVRELAVAPECRRRGLGRGLHAAVIEGAEVDRITLAVRPEAEAAVRMYEALGYRDVGDMTPSWDGVPVHGPRPPVDVEGPHRAMGAFN
ncbi:GNAT family N-acetyltransferase [Streptomyces sp. Y1]|uniref:GNAT family N-acetyltransferase n=1 Tax=Streptomyces sp. Y1 TaxID=3238634 RepID=A0AB39THD1_9ACTN